jgi:peptidoglycan/xylan/chitin deacetylase (PgdA/CDA1 family)
VIAGLATLVALASLPPLLARYSAPQPIGEVIKRVETHESVVALTFDDGPKAPYTGRLLDILAELRAPATFFVTGRQAQAHPELVRRAYEEGHEIGNHTWSHPRFVWQGPELVRRQIDATDRAIRTAGYTGTIPFRSPYGSKGVALWLVLAERGRANVLFDVMPTDYLRPPPETIVADVLANVRPGSIVCLHDGGGDRSATLAAVRVLIPELRARGYRLVTVGELTGSTAAVAQRGS